MKNFLILLLVLSIICRIEAQQNIVESAFVVKPYLQIGKNPSPGSLELIWQTKDTAADWVVEQKNSESASWKKTANPVFKLIAAPNLKARRIYHASFTDLNAGTTFNYRLLKNRKVVFTSQGQASKTSEQAYRFVAFGDIGAGTPEQKPIAQRAYLSKPDLVIVPGDIVYEYGLISEYDTKFWPIYNADQPSEAGAPLLRSVPFVCSPGNHDTDMRDLDKYPDGLAYFLFWDQPLNGPLTAEGSPIAPKIIASDKNRKPFIDAAAGAFPVMANFSFNYGNTHWTIIDSNPYVDFTDTTILNWVIRDLASAKEATWKFVAFHHPGFNSSRDHYEQQHMRLLSPIFEAGKVDVVFSGHVHNYQRTFPLTFIPDKKGTLLVGGKEGKTVRGRVVNGRWKLDKSFDGKSNTTPQGIVYIITGAGGQELYNPEQTNDTDSWQKFTDKFVSTIHSLTVADVNGKTLQIRQLTADGKEIDQLTITK